MHLRHTILLAAFLFVAQARAETLRYRFEGIITGFTSYHSELGIDDFSITLGETEVAYVFEVDFDRDTFTNSNTAGTWNYFYTELLSGSVINGDQPNSGYRGFNWYRTAGNNQGQTTGSALDVRITGYADTTTDWRVQDWQVGQQLRSTDSGSFSDSTGGTAVYAYGDVVLTSITAIPEPAGIAMMGLVVGCGVCVRRFFLV